MLTCMAARMGAAARTWPLRLASRLRFFMRRTGSAIAASAAAEAADTLSAALLPSPAGVSLACHALRESGMLKTYGSFLMCPLRCTGWCNQSRS